MKRTITDAQCYQAAVKRLREHLSDRPMTKAESIDVAAQIEERIKLHKSWQDSPDGLTRSIQQLLAHNAQMDLDAIRGIQSSPLHAYNKTTAELAARVEFYSKRIGLVA